MIHQKIHDIYEQNVDAFLIVHFISEIEFMKNLSKHNNMLSLQLSSGNINESF